MGFKTGLFGRRSISYYRPPTSGSGRRQVDFGDVWDRISRRFPALGGRGGGVIAVLIIVILLIAGVGWLASGFYTIAPGQQAALRTFGKFTGLTEEGLHWFWPSPVGRRDIVTVTETRRLELGFRSGQEGATVAQTVASESLMITGDTNIVDVQAVVQYRIVDLAKYLFNVDDPGEPDRAAPAGRPDGRTLRDVFETALRQVVGQRAIDDVLTTEKEQVQQETLLLMAELLEKYDAGIQLQQVLLQNVNPPTEVRAAFEDVVKAREDKERFINQAQAYQAAQIPKALGQAVQIKQEAEGFKQGRIALATGQAQGFKELLEGYQKSPDITRRRLFLEAMEEILPGINKFIVDPDATTGVVPFLPLGAAVPAPAGGAAK
ncbi:MAG: FtsH protease activity modulator HflK [Chloroflexi bacterium]|nr:FtsH protease activity modulator HflK [Chloroflexota bacterium]